MSPSRALATVLLVEDEPSVRAFMALVLRAAGYDLLEAEDGARAVAIAHAHTSPIELVLADLNLSSLRDGLEVVTAVTAVHPEARTLIVSGEPREDVPGEYLAKPFTPTRLVERVRQVLAS